LLINHVNHQQQTQSLKLKRRTHLSHFNIKKLEKEFPVRKCWRKLENNYKKIFMKYMFESKESNYQKCRAAEQDQKAATRTVAHNRIKISVSTQ
jgi:hypothetical protein